MTIKRICLALMGTAMVAGTMSAGAASAHPVHHVARGQKTHRILANSKSVRINDVGEVIIKQPSMRAADRSMRRTRSRLRGVQPSR